MWLATSNAVANSAKEFCNEFFPCILTLRNFLVWFEVLCGYVWSFSSGELDNIEC